MADTAPGLNHRRVFAIAWPIVLSNATVPLLGLVDTGVVGQLGAAAPIGAVGLGAVILSAMFFIFNFLRMGTTGLVAQAHGARDGLAGTHLARGIAVGLAIGLVLVAAQGPLFAAALRLAPASAEVERLARSYLGIRIWGAPATIATFALSGYLIGVERMRAVMVLQIAITATNMLLDVLFVLSLSWGVAGVAVATVIADWTGLLLGLWLVRAALAGAIRQRGLVERAALARLARVNGDLLVRSLLLQIALAWFTFAGAGFGDVTLAANQVLMQFLMITAYALDGFAFAAETLVGQSVGARAPVALRRAAGLVAQWAVAGAVLLAAVFLLAGPAIIDLLTTAPDVRAAARAFLFWAALAPVAGVVSWLFDGIFIGATLTREMRLTMTLSFALFLGAVLTLPQMFGNHGLWAALIVLYIARGASMAVFLPRVMRAAAPI